MAQERSEVSEICASWLTFKFILALILYSLQTLLFSPPHNFLFYAPDTSNIVLKLNQYQSKDLTFSSELTG